MHDLNPSAAEFRLAQLELLQAFKEKQEILALLWWITRYIVIIMNRYVSRACWSDILIRRTLLLGAVRSLSPSSFLFFSSFRRSNHFKAGDAWDMGHVGTGDGLGNILWFQIQDSPCESRSKPRHWKESRHSSAKSHSVGWKSLQSFKWSNLDCTRFFAWARRTCEV